MDEESSTSGVVELEFVKAEESVSRYERLSDEESNPLLDAVSLSADELQPGDRVQIAWQPNRVCLLEKGCSIPPLCSVPSQG